MRISIFQLLTQSYGDMLPWYFAVIPGIFIVLFILKTLSSNIFFYMTFYEEFENDGFKFFALGMFTFLYIAIFLIAIFYKFPIIMTT